MLKCRGWVLFWRQEGQHPAAAGCVLIGCSLLAEVAVLELQAEMEELSAVGEQVFDAECILNKRVRKVRAASLSLLRTFCPLFLLLHELSAPLFLNISQGKLEFLVKWRGWSSKWVQTMKTTTTRLLLSFEQMVCWWAEHQMWILSAPVSGFFPFYSGFETI